VRTVRRVREFGLTEPSPKAGSPVRRGASTTRWHLVIQRFFPVLDGQILALPVMLCGIVHTPGRSLRFPPAVHFAHVAGHEAQSLVLHVFSWDFSVRER
jgi:hypothetical protein